LLLLFFYEKTAKKDLLIKIQLSDEQRKELNLFRRQASAADSENALMVLMSSDGKTVKQIARTLKRNPHTVRDWLKRYQAKGLDGLARKFSPGRPDDKRMKLMEHIAKIVSKPPASFGYQDAAWTVPLIAHYVNNQIGLDVSRDTVVRALKSMGYSYERHSKRVPGSAPSPEEKRLAVNKIAEQIKELMKKKDCIIYALGESYFSTEPYLVQGWFKKKVAATRFKRATKEKVSRSLDA
jgi:transposase